MDNWINRYRGVIFVLVAILTLGGGSFVYFRDQRPPPATEIVITEPSDTPTPTATSTVTPLPTPTPTWTPAPLRVYISGEVQSPDVYVLPPGSIIKDALEAAGGPTEQADLEVINLALELKDQQQINVPGLADAVPTPPVIQDGPDPTPTPAPAFAPPPEAGSSLGPEPRVININTANFNELTLITGVGPATARKIIDYREANNGFKTIEEIMEISGIGPVTFEKMKAQITVE